MEKELSLRDVADAILKQKWMIVIIMLASILLGSILTVFVMNTTYESSAFVNIQSTAEERGNTPDNIKTFTEGLRSRSLLNTVIEKNKLDRKELSVESLRSMFSIENKSDELLKIKVRGEDPKKITLIANLLAAELGVIVEVSDRSQLIGFTQRRLNELTDEIAIARSEYEEAQKQLASVQEFKVAKQVLADNELLRSILQEKANTNAKTSAVLELESELINPAYSDMQSKVAETSIALNSLLSEEKALKQKVDENTSRINEIESKSNSEKLTENTVVRVMDGSNVISITPAFQPEKPVGPKLLMNVMLAAILGAVLSVLIVFLRHQLGRKPRSGVIDA